MWEKGVRGGQFIRFCGRVKDSVELGGDRCGPAVMGACKQNKKMRAVSNRAPLLTVHVRRGTPAMAGDRQHWESSRMQATD